MKKDYEEMVNLLGLSTSRGFRVLFQLGGLWWKHIVGRPSTMRVSPDGHLWRKPTEEELELIKPMKG